MKEIISFFILGIIVSCVWFKIGSWYGHEKAVVEVQEAGSSAKLFDNGSSAEYYNQYLLKNCLLKVKELEIK